MHLDTPCTNTVSDSSRTCFYTTGPGRDTVSGTERGVQLADPVYRTAQTGRIWTLRKRDLGQLRCRHVSRLITSMKTLQKTILSAARLAQGR